MFFFFTPGKETFDFGNFSSLDDFTFPKKVDTVSHGTLSFITGCSSRVPHCTLSNTVNCPSLSSHRLFRKWLTFIHKSLLGLVPQYLCLWRIQYVLRSQDVLQMSEGLATIWFGNSKWIQVNLRRAGVRFSRSLSLLQIFQLFFSIFLLKHLNTLNSQMFTVKILVHSNLLVAFPV